MRPPNRCATRTTRVRGVRATSSIQGRGASVSGSMSTGTARRPSPRMIRTMSGCVTAETRTSSQPADPAPQATGPTHSSRRNKPVLLLPKSTGAEPHLLAAPFSSAGHTKQNRTRYPQPRGPTCAARTCHATPHASRCPETHPPPARTHNASPFRFYYYDLTS